MTDEIKEILKQLVARDKKLTVKPLGIRGNVAEFNAAALLDLKLAESRIFDG